MSTNEFAGFPAAGLQFLADLKENNNKDWFEQHRQTYESELLAPAVAFVAAVGEALQAEIPGLRYDTRTNGSGSLMRIYRDTRFSKDKTPYKSNISGMWWSGPGKKTGSPAFGFQLTPDGMGLMAGLFGFDKEQLAAFRQAVDNETSGRALAEALASIQAAGRYDLLGDQTKKVPRGYDDDHPRADLLKYKGLWTHPSQELSPEVVQQPDLLEQVLTHFRTMRPLQQWLADHL